MKWRDGHRRLVEQRGGIRDARRQLCARQRIAQRPVARGLLAHDEEPHVGHTLANQRHHGAVELDRVANFHLSREGSVQNQRGDLRAGGWHPGAIDVHPIGDHGHRSIWGEGPDDLGGLRAGRHAARRPTGGGGLRGPEPGRLGPEEADARKRAANSSLQPPLRIDLREIDYERHRLVDGERILNHARRRHADQIVRRLRT